MDLTREDFELPPLAQSRAELGEALELSASALERANRAALRSGQPLAVAMSLLGLAGEERVAEACVRLYHASPWPDALPLSDLGVEGVSAGFLRDRYGLAVMDDEGRLHVGLVDPGDPHTLDALRFALGKDADLHTLTLSAWRRAQTSAISTKGEEREPPHAAATWLDDAERLKDISRDAPVVRMAEQFLDRAWLVGASDLHIEQKADHTRVRLRIDGGLQDLERLSPELGPALIARIKVLSDLDVAQRRTPQDGRSTFSVRGVPVDVRISTAPTVFGESLVVRLLTRRHVDYDLERLGLRSSAVEGVTELLARPHGLLLVTGPTGSGKTTTLYAALRLLASTRTKILTIEDPVEYVFEDILQSQVNEPAGFTFSTALRSFLRHDPDVILVGEIRDAETARLAVQASLTGHLVLATVHTNDAATTPSRLVDMGVERYLLADALIGVLAQRLAPLLCLECRQSRPPTAEEKAQAEQLGLEVTTLFDAEGCEGCGGAGRKGRRAVAELMVCDETIAEAIGRGAPARDVVALAQRQDGYVGLRRDAALQALDGALGWADAWRVGGR